MCVCVTLDVACLQAERDIGIRAALHVLPNCVCVAAARCTVTHTHVRNMHSHTRSVYTQRSRLTRACVPGAGFRNFYLPYEFNQKNFYENEGEHNLASVCAHATRGTRGERDLERARGRKSARAT